jgi:hypothetical protein
VGEYPLEIRLDHRFSGVPAAVEPHDISVFREQRSEITAALLVPGIEQCLVERTNIAFHVFLVHGASALAFAVFSEVPS